MKLKLYRQLGITAGIVQLGYTGNLTINKLYKNTSELIGFEATSPSQTIPVNRCP